MSFHSTPSLRDFISFVVCVYEKYNGFANAIFLSPHRLRSSLLVGIRTDLKLFEEELKINVIAPVATTRAFIPLLEKGTAKKVLYVTTEMGSLTLSAQVPFLSQLPL